MAEMEDKLNALLSDPSQMEQIMQLAQQLSGSMGITPSPSSSPPPPQPPSAPGGLDMASVARFLPLLQELNGSNSQVTQLLYALQPFLKPEKQEKIQRAAKLARLIHVGKRVLTEMGGLGDV